MRSPSPIHLLVSEEAEMLKKVAPTSCAMAFPMRVLPGSHIAHSQTVMEEEVEVEVEMGEQWTGYVVQDDAWYMREKESTYLGMLCSPTHLYRGVRTEECPWA